MLAEAQDEHQRQQSCVVEPDPEGPHGQEQQAVEDGAAQGSEGEGRVVMVRFDRFQAEQGLVQGEFQRGLRHRHDAAGDRHEAEIRRAQQPREDEEAGEVEQAGAEARRDHQATGEGGPAGRHAAGNGLEMAIMIVTPTSPLRSPWI